MSTASTRGVHPVDLAFRVADVVTLDAVHRTLLARDDVEVEFAPEPLGSTGLWHMMCAVAGGVRLELVAEGPSRD